MRTKVLLLFSILFLSTPFLQAQYVDIPDPVFREWMETDYPGCMSEGKLDTNCTDILILTEVNDDVLFGIKDLTGIQYFKNLVSIYSEGDAEGDNRLEFIPALPPNLKSLGLFNHDLVSLPLLPATLSYLACQSGKLKSLPALPNSITELYCGDNQITYLPSLPEGLTVLNCEENRIVSLPVLPSTLSQLMCFANDISEVPALPPHLGGLYISGNNLATLPVLPNSLKQLEVGSNPNLTCLPVLPESMGVPIIIAGFIVSNLSVGGTGITCLPNIPGEMFTSPPDLPVCEDASSTCQSLAVIQGRVYVDENDNGTFDPDIDAKVTGVVIHAMPANRSSVSSINGEYTLLLDTATNNTWTAIVESEYWNTVPSSFSLEPSTTGTQAGLFDFALIEKGAVKDLEVHIGAPPFLPGFRTRVAVNAQNSGTVNEENATLILRKPAGFTITYADPPYSGVSGNTVTWTGINLQKWQDKRFMLVVKVPEDTPLGTEVLFETWLTSTGNDTTPENNYARWTDTVVGSFDPNDKLVDRDIIPVSYSEEDGINYTIRFQNTGTYKAFTVVVKDEIPDNLDISTLQVVNASHQYQLFIREKNIVEVVFPNIQLPDSASNEAASHGFVQLSLKPKAGLPIGEEIKNSASIFFDFNSPVITNEAITTVNIISGVASNKKLDFKVFPNPASQLLRIELPYSEEGKWLLSDISGRVLHENYFPSGSHQLEIPVNLFPAGTYFLTLQMGGERSTAKVIVLR